ncbi:ferrochelatase [Limosilactobacillus albertensis]|uniref:Coproporphyrin III ferrochelatase n=1 Tax=Limosilactobacillus albertensis TaxID=2759752 RepID=A0A839GZ48_9LACO|nr:ferrochelatase [Limosilactobacillus albertensis]MBB1123645.1 ferrochelatase [Limosilactobacillus albertensis]MCD7123130.1 ferrochelatase [Limosilactobacillus albertensis]
MKENGLLLVNLGSPDTPTTPDVKRYLKEFLSDRNVIEMPPALWQPLLRGIIIPMRSWRSATFYRNCWTTDGSPLIAHTERLVKKVQALMPDWTVKMAMNYGHPAISDTITAMKKECRHLTVLPLFPFFTKSTTQTVIDKVTATDPNAKIIDRFSTEEGYLTLLTKQIQTAWDNGNYDKLLISYHGIPTAMVNHGDPYRDETEAATAELIKRLDIPEEKIKMAYQSKFGPMPWLKPYLRNTLLSEAQLGHRNVLVAAPSFVADCLETLEEDQVQNYQYFRENGGDNLTMVPSLNDSSEFAQFIAELVKQRR